MKTLKKVTKKEFSKRMVMAILSVILIDYQLHFVLAFLGLDPLVDLAKLEIGSVVSVVVVYSAKAFFGKFNEEKVRLEEKAQNFIQDNIGLVDLDISEDEGGKG